MIVKVGDIIKISIDKINKRSFSWGHPYASGIDAYAKIWGHPYASGIDAYAKILLIDNQTATICLDNTGLAKDAYNCEIENGSVIYRYVYLSVLDPSRIITKSSCQKCKVKI